MITNIYLLHKKYQSLPVQVKASFWFLFCTFVQKGISVIATPIFTRIMTTADYGRFSTFDSWHGIVSIIVALSLTAGVHMQGLIKFDQDRSAFSSSLQGLSTVLVLAWAIVYVAFYQFWNQIFSLTSVQMFCMFIIMWSASTFGFWANEQCVRYEYKNLVAITLISSLLSTVFGILLVLRMEDKATARIIGWTISNLLCFGWIFFVQMKSGKVFYSKRFWKYALVFNLPLVPHYLSQTVLNSADRIMIQRMIGNSEAGIYSLAYSLALIMTIFNNALMQTLNPWIYQKIRDKRESDIAPIAYSTMMLIAILNLFLILLAPEAVAIFAPKEYYDAIWIIPPVAISVFFMYIYDFFAKFAFYYEKTIMIMLASIAGAMLNIVLNYIFIRKFGYVAAGYTTLVCYAVYIVAHYLFMRRICRQYCESRYPFETKKILVITLLFMMIGLLCILLYRQVVIRYSVVVAGIVIAIVLQKKITKTLQNIMKIKSILRGA